MSTEVERIAVLEAKVERLEAMDAKLDELLQLKDRGMGAFWFASLLVGSGILGFINYVLHWIKS